MTKSITPESLWSESVNDVLRQTASTSPVPGGGSIGALSATLGLGLIIMALEITAKRELPESHKSDVSALLQRARIHLERLKEHAPEDIRVFQAYMDALGLPKHTEEEKGRRRVAIDGALIRATKAPLAAGKDSYEGLCIAAASSPIVHDHVVSDVGAGAYLLLGATKAILLNVNINVRSLKDDEIKRNFTLECDKILRESLLLTEKVEDMVYDRLSKGS